MDSRYPNVAQHNALIFLKYPINSGLVCGFRWKALALQAKKSRLNWELAGWGSSSHDQKRARFAISALVNNNVQLLLVRFWGCDDELTIGISWARPVSYDLAGLIYL